MTKINPRIVAMVSALCMAFVASNEGTIYHTYRDQGGVWTACTGHTDKTLVAGMKFTQAQCDAYEKQDLQTAALEVDRDIKVALNDNQRSALVDFTFNVGTGSFRSSHLVTYLNQGLYTKASSEFLKWDIVSGKHNAGVHARRVREAALFNRTMPKVVVPSPKVPDVPHPINPPAGRWAGFLRLLLQR